MLNFLLQGNISFDEVGDRTPEIRYLQYQSKLFKM